jgi:hypothetical protein
LIVEGKGIMNQSPQAPVNLSVDQDSTGMHLHWEASADDHTPTSGLTFDVILYRNGKAITKGLLNTATGSRLKLQKGREFTTLFLRHLTPGEYTWKVQAVDQNFRGSDLSMESNFIFRPLPPGIAGEGPCYEFSEPFLITATEIDIHAELKIFPNPVTDDFSIEVPAMNSGNLQILDVNGKIIYGKTLDNSTSQTITIPSAGWSNGIYFITKTNGQRKFFGKIVKL